MTDLISDFGPLLTLVCIRPETNKQSMIKNAKYFQTAIRKNGISRLCMDHFTDIRITNIHKKETYNLIITCQKYIKRLELHSCLYMEVTHMDRINQQKEEVSK